MSSIASLAPPCDERAGVSAVMLIGSLTVSICAGGASTSVLGARGTVSIYGGAAARAVHLTLVVLCGGVDFNFFSATVTPVARGKAK